MRTDAEIMADLDARFSFASGPVRSYATTPLAPPPADPPAKEQHALPKLTIGQQVPKDRGKRQNATTGPGRPRKAYPDRNHTSGILGISKDVCSHRSGFYRIGAAKREGYRRERCKLCGTERTIAATVAA